MEVKVEMYNLDEDLNQLPLEIRLHLFSFFNQKELKTIAPVNKKFYKFFHEKRGELINKYKSNIFYTVGKPIRFLSNEGRSFFGDIGRDIVYRKEIPLKEIYDSFSGQSIEHIKLFKIEDEAYEYSRFLREGNHFNNEKDSFQPAVFKVIYLGETNNLEIKREEILINGGFKFSPYDLKERTSRINFFEAKRIDVIPLKGILKIHYYHKEDLRSYGIIDYSTFNLPKEEKPIDSEKCIIC